MPASYIFSYLIFLLNSTNENIAIYYDTDINPEDMHFDRSAAVEIASTNQIDIKNILLQRCRDLSRDQLRYIIPGIVLFSHSTGI